MATLVQKFRTVRQNPALRRAYLRWLWTKAISGSSPALQISETTRISNWLGFSEYWSFHEGIPSRERAFIERHLPKNGTKAVALDVGANIGIFSCFLGSRPSTEVHAFEPIPETFCRLKANISENKLLNCCRLNCLAVGKDNHLVTFRMEENSPATNRLFVSGHNTSKSLASLQTVATVRLDDYCRTVGLEEIDFLKIDVEGMEPYVLEGAEKLLQEKKVGAVLMEICPDNLRSVGLSPEILCHTIAATGYTPFELQKDGSKGRRLELKDISETVLANVVLLPE